MKKDNITQSIMRAQTVLKLCSTAKGFFASGLPGGYEALWARDSMIASLGASLVEKRFKKPFADSLTTLSKRQSKHGQIPNAVGSYNTERRSDITYNTIDSTLWYLIGHFVYARAYNDNKLKRKYKNNINEAFKWLEYQDPNEDGLLVQQPTMDWQDAFPHKYGRAINTHALYYAALKMHGRNKSANHLKRIVNGEIEKYLSLYDEKRGYYLPWIWKSHDRYREEGKWFDTLGNLLAIITGLSTPRISRKILKYIEKEKINLPFPCKAIWPPIKKGDREWHSYFSMSDAREPLEYLNAGIWPFIGGFYVAALVKTKQFKKAEKELEKLMEANSKVGGDAFAQGLKKTTEWGFQEWLDGKTGKPIGHSNPYQAWSAGMYIFANNCVETKRVKYFTL